MFAITYTYTHQVIYPLSAIFCYMAEKVHRRLLEKWAQPANYNADHLNYNAIQYLYAGVALHWGVIFVGYRLWLALIMCIVLVGLLFFRNTLVMSIENFARKRMGPFCFSQWKDKQSSTPLSSLLSPSQIGAQINCLENKIRKSTLLYSNRFPV